ncbi:MAG: hypothetical protein WCR52_11560 [Bacteroidota bacterium]
MMNKQQDIELIEQYLDNQLNESDLTSFEARLANDAELRASLDLQRHVQAELANAAQIKLLHTLHDVVQTPFDPIPEKEAASKSYIAWWMIGIITLFVVGYLIYTALQPAASPGQSQPPVLPKTDVQPAEQTPAQTPKSEKPAQVPKTTEPIAALNPADFQANRTLDPLIGSQVRGGGAIEASFTQPAKPLNLTSQNGRIRFLVNGIASADEQPEKDALQLLLFSNRDADFLNNKPIQKFPLALVHAGESYNFSKKIDQNLKPGLYYLVLVEKDLNEPLAVQKIRVNRSN